VSRFARAYRDLERHDVDGLGRTLDRFPHLVGSTGTNGNDLLGMATATCDERLVALLLERGANPAAADAHGWTPLHQAAYRGLPVLAQLLIDAGAPIDVSARGDGGTPLVVALFFGHRETAELLAERRVVPLNLRTAAGLGRPELIDELVAADGRLAPEAGEERGFYRPHSGFPAWGPLGRSSGGPRRGALVGGDQRAPRSGPSANRTRSSRGRADLPEQRSVRGSRPRQRRDDLAPAAVRC
jgi:ankyrin repeat protein